MKRIAALILCLSLFMTGCGFLGERTKDPVRFYYLCDQYQEDLCCVIVAEEREASGHVGDLPYLLALYLMGPVRDEISLPLPAGTKISSSQEAGHIDLELSVPDDSLSEINFTLACSCLALTCLEIADAQDVTIHCGDRVRTIDRSLLMLHDSVTETTPTEETQ